MSNITDFSVHYRLQGFQVLFLVGSSEINVFNIEGHFLLNFWSPISDDYRLLHVAIILKEFIETYAVPTSISQEAVSKVYLKVHWEKYICLKCPGSYRVGSMYLRKRNSSATRTFHVPVLSYHKATFHWKNIHRELHLMFESCKALPQQ